MVLKSFDGEGLKEGDDDDNNGQNGSTRS